MGIIVVGLGLFMDTIFYFATREPKDGRRLSRLNSISSETSHLVRMTWRDWFSQVPFYQASLKKLLTKVYRLQYFTPARDCILMYLKYIFPSILFIIWDCQR